MHACLKYSSRCIRYLFVQYLENPVKSKKTPNLSTVDTSVIVIFRLFVITIAIIMKKFKRSRSSIQNNMKYVMNSKLPFIFLIMAAAIGTSFILSNNNNLAIAQTFSVPNTQSYSVGNIGNATDEQSDSFFQLDDAVQTTQSLINQSLDAINNNNTAEALNSLNQAYNETVQIQNNANNLIWDAPSSNEGA